MSCEELKCSLASRCQRHQTHFGGGDERPGVGVRCAAPQSVGARHTPPTRAACRRSCSAAPPYSNRYSNPVNFGGVRDCSLMCSKRLDLPKRDTHTHVRTLIIQPGVKWSQVQILSARRRSEAFFGLETAQFCGVDPHV